ncbi:riboflavin synthase [bacterium]|nr:riboflavin synthase [bacterium]
MFTGLIEEMGTVKSISRRAGSMELTISGKEVVKDMRKGDSISVNGVCLTVTSLQFTVTSFSVDVGAETLRKTNLEELRIGEKVNLERALKVGERLGGHFVTGHINGVGIIKKKVKEGETFLFEIEAPGEIMDYVIPKGSIAVDGISLTVVDFSPPRFAERGRGKNRFRVSIIPHTLEVTTLDLKKVGDKINLEADMIGKYVSKMIKEEKGIDLDFLKRHGYL